MISNRVIIIVVGLVLSYLAAYFGDGINAIIRLNWNLEGSPVFSVILGVITAVVAIIGFIILTAVLKDIFFLERSAINKDDKDGEALGSLFSAIVLTCVFGVLAEPFTNYGPYPWYWISKWAWLLVVAFVPTIFVIKYLIFDVAQARREKADLRSKNTVPPNAII